ncbi:MAG: hypothetical protein AAGE03_02790 [Pseudomonadota bacterium]
MTDDERDLILFLAEMYLRLGRANHAMLLLAPLVDAEPGGIALTRLMLRGHIARGEHRAALACIDRLVEHEFSSAELAFALAMQARALASLGRDPDARSAWAECVVLCRGAQLDIMDYAR